MAASTTSAQTPPAPAAAPAGPAHAAAKPAPELMPHRPSRWRQLLDLCWLVRLVAADAPLFCALWAPVSLGQGLLVPAQLWFTKNAVDALAAQIGGSGGQGSWPRHWSEGPGDVALWLGLLVATLLLERALGGVQPWLQAVVREETAGKLQERMMRQAAGLDLAAFEYQAYYDRLNRVMSNAESRGPQLLQSILQIVRTVPAVLGYTVALAAVAPVLLAIGLAGLVPSLGLFVIAGQSVWRLLSQQTRERRLAEYYASVLTERPFAKEVRLYGLAGHLRQRWAALFWQTRNEQRRLAARLAIQQRGVVLAASAVGMVGLLWVVAAGLTDATPGEYALLFQSLNGLFGVVELSGMLKGLGEQSGYASELRAFLRLPSESVASGQWSVVGDGHLPSLPPGERQTGGEGTAFPRPLERGIRFEDVWFTYPGSDHPAIAGVTFEVRAGEKVALVGENGAGKTTLVKLLLGLYVPDAGRITFDGVDSRELDPVSLRCALSAVFQQYVRYQLTFRENVGLADPARLHDFERLRQAAARAGAADVAAGLSQEYETLLGPDVGGVDLSGGQWQRVALARAFFRKAEVLVLDEPTAALDPLAELAIFERFAELAAGRTAILISHRLGMARLADRVLALDQGRLVEQGSHVELIRAGGVYAALFAAQAKWYA